MYVRIIQQVDHALKIKLNTIPPKSTSHSLFRSRKFVYDHRPIIIYNVNLVNKIKIKKLN